MSGFLPPSHDGTIDRLLFLRLGLTFHDCDEYTNYDGKCDFHPPPLGLEFARSRFCLPAKTKPNLPPWIYTYLFSPSPFDLHFEALSQFAFCEEIVYVRVYIRPSGGN